MMNEWSKKQMKSKEEQIEFEKWAFIQEIDARDVSDSICDCPAIADAIRNNDWRGVADLVKSRIELKALRVAELRVYDEICTHWVDQSDERIDYRSDYQSRTEQMLNRMTKTGGKNEDQDELGRSFGGTQ